MVNHFVSVAKSIMDTTSIVHRVTPNWIQRHVRWKVGQVLQLTIWMNCIACVVTTKWAYRFVVHAVDQSKNVLLPLSGSIGMSSILFVQNVKNHFWAIGITRSAVWPTVKRITINCLAICALSAIKSSPAMVCYYFAQMIRLCSRKTNENFLTLVYNFTVFTALNKAWCVHHFSCSVCDTKMNQKSKFYEYDEKPVCKKCYEKFPNELRRRLRMSHENTMKKPT